MKVLAVLENKDDPSVVAAVDALKRAKCVRDAIRALRWELHNRRDIKIPVDQLTGVSFGVYKVTQHLRMAVYWRGDEVVISHVFMSDHDKSKNSNYSPRRVIFDSFGRLRRC